MNQKQNKNWHCNNCKAELVTDKDIDKAVEDAGDTYQPTLDPKDPKYNP